MKKSVLQHLSHIQTTTELFHRGFSPEKIKALLRSGKLVQLRSGVYTKASYHQSLQTWEYPLLNVAALHKKKPETVFSHLSAAEMYGYAVPAHQETHIYVDRTSMGKMKNVNKHFLRTPDTLIAEPFPGIFCTSKIQTICDSARILATSDALALADSALYSRSVEVSKLRQALRDSKGRNCRRMRYLAEIISPFAESPGESHTRLRLIEMDLAFEEQVEVVVDGYQYWLDLVLKDFPIIVEFDGRIKLTDFGASDRVLEKERARERRLQNAGWFVYRVGWQRVVQEPDLFSRNLRQLIRTVINHRSTPKSSKYS